MTESTLSNIVANIRRSGADPDNEFFYLGGPMTGIAQFNFPAFKEAAAALRERGYNIVSPAELDNPETEKAALASEDGAPGSGSANGESYVDFLARDIIIVSLPTCIGGIFLPGWQRSRGARGESWVLEFLGKQLLAWTNPDCLVVITSRTSALTAAGVADEGVPKDAPGLLTQAGRSYGVSESSKRRAMSLDTLGPMRRR